MGKMIGMAPAQAFILFNENQKGIDPIKVKLPTAPDEGYIHGTHLKKEDQVFTRLEIPERLARIEQIVYRKKKKKEDVELDEIWDELEENKEFYSEEIRFMRKVQYHIRYGYWFMCDGVPTYLTGWHFFYLNFWYLGNVLPEYRDRDRKFFIFAEYCYKDDKSYGFLYPKHRREGATSKAACINYIMTIRKMSAHSGIQSMTDEHAKEVFTNHIVHAWKRLPFYLRSYYMGNADPQGRLYFNPPAMRKGSMASSAIGLDSSIGYRNSKVKAYDAYKLLFYHQDEIGKTEKVSVINRWATAKKVLAQGNGRFIDGFTIGTSTVGEMKSGGGEQFRKFCRMSRYSQRDSNGQTTSGLYVLFIPATEGLDGFVDKFGNSIVNTPTKEQEDYMRKQWLSKGKSIEEFQPVGSFEYLKNQRDNLEKDEDWVNLVQLIQEAPIYFEDCFYTSVSESGFNRPKIIRRMNIIEEMPDAELGIRRGRFEFVDEPYTSDVVWRDYKMPDQQRFVTSLLLPEEEKSLSYFNSDLGVYMPISPGRFIAGGDPFKYRVVRGKKKSFGAGSVFYNFDETVDGGKRDSRDWESSRFVCNYLFRASSKEEYCIDMAAMCKYYRCLILAEIDNPVIWDGFELNAYAGYLLYMTKKDSSGYMKTPGILKNAAQETLFTETMSHIEHNVDRERHKELLEQWRSIEGPEQLTNHDLVASAGYALIGAKTHHMKISPKLVPNNDFSLDSFYGA